MPFFLTIALAAFLGGSVTTLAKLALISFPTFTLLFIRFFIATITLFPLIIHSKELSLKNFAKLLPLGIIGSLNPIILFMSLRYTSASVSPLIYAAVPLLTAIYVSTKKSETLSRNAIKGIILGFFGVSIIILLPLITHSANWQLTLKGNLMIFLAVLFFTTYGLLSRNFSRHHALSPIALTFYFTLCGLLITLPLALNDFFSGSIIWSTITFSPWFSAIATGLFGTTLFYLTYQQAVKVGGATAASLFTYLQPIAGILFPVILLHETISIPFVIGAILAVYGAYLATK
jgi:drug/metabolite transporter (DMT)-like permease